MDKMKAKIGSGEKRFSAPRRDESVAWKFDPNPTYNEVTLSEEWKNHRPPEYFEYRKAWDEVPRTKTELDFPIHLDIETTTHCNLKCPFCPRTALVNEGKYEDGNFMTRKHYKNIIDQGAAHNVSSVKLEYLGEPLLHKDVIWQVAYAKKKGIVDVIMNTNGTALTKKKGEDLLRAGVDGVFISQDAVNPRDYEPLRVGSKLGRVIDNVYNFATLRDKIRPGCQIRVGMIMYDDPKWWDQFQALQVMWRDVVDMIGYRYYSEFDPNVIKQYPEVEGFHCSQPFQRMMLKYNGNVTVCCVDEQDEEAVGNWQTTSLYDIWNGEKFRRVRKLHADGDYYKMDICRKCYMPCSKKQTDEIS